MPKTIFQRVIFTILMVFVMVYAMICYNIAISKSGMTNEVFLLAFHELIIMMPVAFILEFFVVEKLALGLAFKIATPKDHPFFVQTMISACIVVCMCPIMSLIATLLFKNAGREFVAVWLQTTIFNFPMALFWQMFFAGPVVRSIFRKMFKKELVKSN